MSKSTSDVKPMPGFPFRPFNMQKNLMYSYHVFIIGLLVPNQAYAWVCLVVLQASQNSFVNAQAYAIHIESRETQAYILQCTNTLTVVTLARISSRFKDFGSGSGKFKASETEMQSSWILLGFGMELNLLVAARFIPAGDDIKKGLPL